MKTEQHRWTRSEGWVTRTGSAGLLEADLVLIFGAGAALARRDALAELRRRYPQAAFVGCSTAGEISGTEVTDDSIVATAVQFENTELRTVRAKIGSAADSHATGRQLGQALALPGLAHVFVLSEGLHVNGSELARGLTESLPPGVEATGGLAGDGASFQRTWVCLDGDVVEDHVVGVGFYGDRFRVGFGCQGGWDPFGPERMVTRSRGNVLFELDGQPALDLYRTYLGEHATRLPGSGLLFPLSVRSPEVGCSHAVRTILGIDENERSMTFAGDVPEGWRARLMRASFERLIDGAGDAARSTAERIGPGPAGLAILISCVGRRLVLKQRIEEELESVRDVLGPDAVLGGFYSYGEISPFAPSTPCELHNQTMTITTLCES